MELAYYYAYWCPLADADKMYTLPEQNKNNLVNGLCSMCIIQALTYQPIISAGMLTSSQGQFVILKWWRV